MESFKADIIPLLKLIKFIKSKKNSQRYLLEILLEDFLEILKYLICLFLILLQFLQEKHEILGR